MKTQLETGRRAWGPARAFTLVELMVTMALFTVVIGGVIYSHITGLKMYELTKAKLGANDQTRTALGLLVGEVRSAHTLEIGHVSGSTFTQVADGSPQEGAALQIYPTTDTNVYILYYLDASDAKLKRMLSGSSAKDIVAENITNTVVFRAEDYAGTVLTENQNNRVIGVTLQFYQIQYPIVAIGEGQHYEFYQLNTRITRREL